MKLHTLLAAALAAALLLGGCSGTEPSASASSPEAENSQAASYDLEQLTEEYLTPIAISGMGAQNWDDPEELQPDQFISYYVVWAMPAERDLETPETVPADELEAKLQERFDVSSEFLRQSGCYDPDTGLYTPGYVGSAGRAEVTAAREEDGRLLLDYVFFSPADDTTVIRTGILTLEPAGEGWKYLSCVTEAVSDDPAQELA